MPVGLGLSDPLQVRKQVPRGRAVRMPPCHCREQLVLQEMAEENLAFTSYVRMLQYVQSGQAVAPRDMPLPGDAMGGAAALPWLSYAATGFRLLPPSRTTNRSLCESNSLLRSALLLGSTTDQLAVSLAVHGAGTHAGGAGGQDWHPPRQGRAGMLGSSHSMGTGAC